MDFGRQNWFAASAREHRAAREAVAIFDMTSFAKFELGGRDAQAALPAPVRERHGHAGRPDGVHAAAQRAGGGFESDLTVARLAPERFLIVTGTAQATRDLCWIRDNIPPGMSALLTDVSAAWAVLAVVGPRSREVSGARQPGRLVE